MTRANDYYTTDQRQFGWFETALKACRGQFKRPTSTVTGIPIELNKNITTFNGQACSQLDTVLGS